VAFRPRLATGLAFLLMFYNKHSFQVIVKYFIYILLNKWGLLTMADISGDCKPKRAASRGKNAGSR
jgi:hypothetical protein